jgi:spermidine/putrescine transport system permease protein potC
MKKIKWSILYIVIILFITYLPLFLVVLFSFNESKLTVEFTSFSLKWYKQLFSNGELREALINSLILGGVSVLVSAIIGTLGAIGLVRANFKFKGIFEYLTNVPIMVPEIILGMVFMAFFSLIKLPFGMVTLVIAHTSFCIPYILMTVRARLVSIDKSLEEAAYDLGASQKRIFFDITVPLIMPAIISGCILAFAMSFDDVVISIFVNSPKSNTLPIKIYTQLKTGVTPEINALCTVILIVVIFILVFGEILVTKKDKQNLM